MINKASLRRWFEQVGKGSDHVAEGVPDFRHHSRTPSLVDSVEAFLERVRIAQLGLVLHTAIEQQPLPVVQVALALEQYKPVVHQASALLVRQLLAQAFSDLLDGVIGHPDDVKLVDDDPGIR